jgi:hypothetical protein
MEREIKRGSGEEGEKEGGRERARESERARERGALQGRCPPTRALQERSFSGRFNVFLGRFVVLYDTCTPNFQAT